MAALDSSGTGQVPFKHNNSLRFVPIGIDTQEEYFVYVKAHSPIVISEGFETLTRLQVDAADRKIVATLSIIHSDLLKEGEVSLSESAHRKLDVSKGDEVRLYHLPPITSLSLVRSKIHGNRLSEASFLQIITDIEEGRYSNIHVASFITACYGDNLDVDEITYLTRSMVATGKKLDWGKDIVVDKHCVGGIPGNRTTPIVVAIVASAGLIIPKTSSRAITSPAGTADTMDTMAPVDLTLERIQEVVNEQNGCIVWGSAAGLSPVDDRIIKVERALDIDSEGQMIASILSKKVAVGSTHVIIDIPVGPTAKVRSHEKAQSLKQKLTVVGTSIGLNIKVLITDGNQPIGSGIGPVLEARDVLAVLQNKKNAPLDLRNKSILIAGAIFETVGLCEAGSGEALAREKVTNGEAWDKFYSICEAQGGFREFKQAPFRQIVRAQHQGIISYVDNRKLAVIAKLAGAPHDQAAGLQLFVKIGTSVEKGQPLYCVHSESKGELNYALNYAKVEPTLFKIK